MHCLALSGAHVDYRQIEESSPCSSKIILSIKELIIHLKPTLPGVIMKFVQFIILSLIFSASSIVCADTYPSKPIRMIVPAAAGGTVIPPVITELKSRLS